jgi:fructuronate reductase
VKLNNAGLKDTAVWEKAGFLLPRFNREAMIRATEVSPRWVHFGAGNIFRIFPAALQQTLLEQGLEESGIIVAEGYDGEIIDRVFAPYDNLTVAVTLKADGAIEKRVIASIARALRLDRAEDYRALGELFCKASLQMASFTITEKGYAITGHDGGFLPDAAADFTAGPDNSKSYLGKIASLCYARYRAGQFPLALVSMDNCSHNGEKLCLGLEPFARRWLEKGLVDKGFLDYIQNPAKVSFPWTVIDKITPRPGEGVRAMLEEAGLEDTAEEVTAKNTYVAPFVNAEETQYLVIEDAFPAGRPALEKAGVLFTRRDRVNAVEQMKVCTCLNPLHTTLAVFGCLLGYTKISDEMGDPDLVKLIERIGYKEGLPVVTDPGILSPKDFIDQVLQVRFPNPFMPDTPQRIASDTSQKIPIRFGETIKAYLTQGRAIHDLTGIPLTLAAWVRYLLGFDDEGRPFTVSPDPLYESLYRGLSKITLGQQGPFHKELEPILSNSAIFAVNLYKAVSPGGPSLGERVEVYFREMLAGPGAVRVTLKQHSGI